MVEERVKQKLSIQLYEEYLSQWNSIEQIKDFEDGLGVQIVSWLR